MKGGRDDSKEKVRNCSFVERYGIRSSSEMYNEDVICAEALRHFPVWLDN